MAVALRPRRRLSLRPPRRSRAPSSHQLAPAHAPGQTRRRSPRATGRAAAPCGARFASSARIAAQGLGAIVVPAAVAVAVHRQQHARLDLSEAVDHAARAELRRRARPDRADRGDGQQRDERLGDVRHVGDDAIAAPHAQRAQTGGHLRDLHGELRPRQRVQLAQLRGVQDGDLDWSPAHPRARGASACSRRS